MASIAEKYEVLHPELRIDVQSGGSSRGIADLRKGLSDIGMISRKPYSNEGDLKAIPIATDGIAIIVHSSNPIESLSLQEIQNIYTGKTKSWLDQNNTKQPIVVIHKDTGRATREVFLKTFDLNAEQVKANIIIGENAEGIKTVTSNPLAIAYVSIGAAEKEKQLGANIKLLPLNGIPSNLKTLKQGNYPAQRTLNLVVPKNKTLKPYIEKFLQYATSHSTHKIIEDKQFVPYLR
jgi:phosphate transport system substrate-binding protein